MADLTQPIPPQPAAHSEQDPAFEPDVRELGGLARQLCDRLELLTDTAPRDLGPDAWPALRSASEAAARVLDILAWLTDPTKPLPEPMKEPESDTEACVRTWTWWPEKADLRETTDQSVSGGVTVTAVWRMRAHAGRVSCALEVTLTKPLGRRRDDLHLNSIVTCPWEVGAMRLTCTQPTLDPVMRAVLQQVFSEALKGSRAMPSIAIAPEIRRALAEVGNA